MAVELATAYISLVPTTVGLKSAVERQFAPAARIAASSGRDSGHRFAEGFKAATSRVGAALGSSLKVGIGVATAAVAAAGAVGIKTAASMEQSEIAFTTMLGSAKKAKAFLGDLSKFAAKTPFDLPGLQKSASSLVSAGIEADKVIPIMTSLGNATSGMGTGAEGVQRATVALQQMNAAGKISGEDLAQLRDAGIPVFDLLTAATGKTTAEIAEMANAGKLGRTELDQLMSALESGKGLERFNGLMEKQSASLAGLWSSAKDAFEMGMAEAVKPAIPLLKDGLGGATAFLTNTALPKMKVVMTEAAGGIRAFGEAWKANDGDITSSGFPGFMELVAFWLRQAWDWLHKLDFSSLDGFFGSLARQGGPLGTILAGIGDSFRDLWPVVQEFAKQVPGFAMGGLGLLNTALGFLGDHVQDLIAWMPVIVAGFVTWKAVQMAMTVATVAQRIAQEAATNASKIAAAAQWLWNAALTANPIGIVVVAIAALVAGLVWFFTQTELGQQIIQNVWGAIQGFIGATVAWFQTYVLPTVLAVFRAVGAVFEWLWQNVISPVFGFIGALIGAWWKVVSFIFSALVAVVQKVIAPALLWLWRNVVQPVFDGIAAVVTWWWNNIVQPQLRAAVWFFQNVLAPVFAWLWKTIIKPAFDGIGTAIKWVWENVIKPVFDRLSAVIQKDVPKAFDEGVKFVKKVWEGLQEIVKAPIRFVVNTVLNDGLINAMNGIADFLHIDKLPKIALPQGFAAGGWTGPGAKYTPAGLVHADEHVIRKESRRAMERSAPGLLDHINRYGTLAGYAGGGRVKPLKELFVTNGWNHVHKGIDYAASVGTPVFATQDGVVTHAGPGARAPGVWGGEEVHIAGGGFETWFAHLSRIMVTLGQNIRAGQQIALSGNTGISSGPHLHFGVFSGGWPNDLDPSGYLGGAGVPSGGEGWNPIKDLIGGLMDAFKGAFPGGGFLIDVVGGLGKTILTGAADFVGRLFSGASDKKGSLAGPVLFDGGGWLEHTGGAALVAHQSRRPDAVLTGAQWDTMARIAANADGPGVTIHGNVYGDPQDIVDELEARKRRAVTLHNLGAITVGG
jgi:tape measure domain-containing protein